MPLIRNSISLLIVFTVFLGLLYPLSMTGMAHVLFPRQAAGSLVVDQGRVIGSVLIGQDFQSDKYFHSRPSAAGKGYDATNSGGSNLSQTSRVWIDTLKGRIDEAQQKNGHLGLPVPIDLVTASGSGLDPQESLAAAYYQASRIARVRHLPEVHVRQLIADHTRLPLLGFLGEPTVNVLELNRALDVFKTNDPF